MRSFRPKIISRKAEYDLGVTAKEKLIRDVLDLDPFLHKTGVDKTKVFPKSLLQYTSFEVKQCALPLLADAFGMYYNKDAFEKAGISRPPRTM